MQVPPLVSSGAAAQQHGREEQCHVGPPVGHALPDGCVSLFLSLSLLRLWLFGSVVADNSYETYHSTLQVTLRVSS